jgi:hypothetical protein
MNEKEQLVVIAMVLNAKTKIFFLILIFFSVI